MKNFKKQTVRAVALMLVTVMLLLSLSSCKNISKVDVIKSENFTVSAAMITYSLYDTYYYYRSMYGDENMKLYFGIDTEESLKEQYSDAEKGITWFDVFKTDAIDGFCNALALCEAAFDAGVELTDIDRKFIQSEIDEIETFAEKDGLTLEKYIKNIYGDGVKAEDIKKSLELFRLANKMRCKIYDEVTVTTDEIKAAVDKDGDTYLKRDFIYFELTLSNDSTRNQKIEEYAEKINNTTTEADFRAMVDEFVKSEYCVNLENNKKVIKKNVQNNVPEDDKTELDSWAFASGTVVGSSYLQKGNAAHVVYMAVTEPAKDETPTRNMYTIVFEPSVYGTMDECKAKAEEVYALWKNGGESLENFKTLAAKYTTDYESVYSGGYYPNIKKADMVEALDEWLFDEKLEAGASSVIKTEHGYHIIVYAGEGEPVWKVPIIEGLIEEKTSAEVGNFVDIHEVTIVEGNMKYVKAK